MSFGLAAFLRAFVYTNALLLQLFLSQQACHCPICQTKKHKFPVLALSFPICNYFAFDPLIHCSTCSPKTLVGPNGPSVKISAYLGSVLDNYCKFAQGHLTLRLFQGKPRNGCIAQLNYVDHAKLTSRSNKSQNLQSHGTSALLLPVVT